MKESNQYWASPWRTLQQVLANQFGAAGTDELWWCESGNDGVADSASWIERARQRQLQTHPFRQ